MRSETSHYPVLVVPRTRLDSSGVERVLAWTYMDPASTLRGRHRGPRVVHVPQGGGGGDFGLVGVGVYV